MEADAGLGQQVVEILLAVETVDVAALVDDDDVDGSALVDELLAALSF